MANRTTGAATISATSATAGRIRTPMQKRVAVLVVLVGSALIGERVVSLAAGEVAADNAVVEPAAGKARRARPAAALAAAAGTTAATTAATTTADASRVQLDRLDARQRSLATDTVDAGMRRATLFAPLSWHPPPPKAIAVAKPAPPKPVAPPFPYVYLGGLLEDGVRTTFFTQGNRVLSVKAGDTIDAVYRVDQMTEKQMMLTYLPLNEPVVAAWSDGP
jgi:hypothetical protein